MRHFEILRHEPIAIRKLEIPHNKSELASQEEARPRTIHYDQPTLMHFNLYANHLSSQQCEH